MNVLFALDSFKGSLTSLQAGRAAAAGFLRVYPEGNAEVRPLADGGEGSAAALIEGLGGTRVAARVTGPSGNSVSAFYGVLPDGETAVLEMASAAGLPLVAPSQRNPRRTTTRGVGELVRHALARGIRRFVMGIGGSATNDAGAGFLQALGFDLLDASGAPIPPGGEGLARVAAISAGDLAPGLRESSFKVACDVVNPLCGPSGASVVFGPQKGAQPADVAYLDAALAHFAEVARAAGFPSEPEAPGAGAAGGLGYALRTFLNASLVPGADLIAAETGLDAAIAAADLVVTGEGRIDAQTVLGKAPAAVARRAKRLGKPVLALGGCVAPDAGVCHAAGIDAFFPALREVVPLATALDPACAAENLSAASEEVFRLWKTAAESGL